jgi:hypothetical protein
LVARLAQLIQPDILCSFFLTSSNRYLQSLFFLSLPELDDSLQLNPLFVDALVGLLLFSHQVEDPTLHLSLIAFQEPALVAGDLQDLAGPFQLMLNLRKRQ